MKALVIGYGSIGRKHVENLLKTEKIESVSVFTRNDRCVEDFGHTGRLKRVDSFRQSETDFAIIANETHKHLDTALALADEGMDLFIEKPLSHNLDGVEKLKEVVQRKGLRVFVAYNMRFLGAMRRIREELSGGAIGRAYFARIEVGQYLPDWRPGRDYRNTYSANRQMGGGVALDLSHEVDYMRYLFGDPGAWTVLKERTGELEIDSEDLFEGVFRYGGGFVCTVHMDYLQREKRRSIRVVGSNGVITCDLVRKKIVISSNGHDRSIVKESLFDMERTYRDELANFIESIEGNAEPAITLHDGIMALRLIEDGGEGDA